MIAYSDQHALRRALDTRPRVVRFFRAGDMVAVWRRTKHSQRVPHRHSYHRWRPGICVGAVRGNYWIALPGGIVKASPEQIREATQEERRAWRLVEAELRTDTVDLENMDRIKARYEDITRDGNPEEAAEKPEEPKHPTDNLRFRFKQPADSAPLPADQPPVPGSPGGMSVSTPVSTTSSATPLGSIREQVSPPPGLGPMDLGSFAEGVKRDADTAVADERPSQRPRLLDFGTSPARGEVAPLSSPHSWGGSSPAKSDDDLDVFVCGAVGEGPLEDDEVLQVSSCDVLLANGRGEVNLKEDRWKTPEGRALVSAGFKAEMDALVRDTGAWKLASIDESRRVRSTNPDRIMKPRPVWTEREKDGKQVLKCRLTLQGFRDPDLLQLIRGGLTQSPTLSHNGRSLILQLVASFKFLLSIGDIKSAFLVSNHRPRENGAIYVSMPAGMCEDGVDSAQLYEVRNGYGLGDQPQQWWATFRDFCLESGLKQHPLDPCVFMMHEPLVDSSLPSGENRFQIPRAAAEGDVGAPGSLCGLLGVHVDDVLSGGRGRRWDEFVDKLRSRFRFGKWQQREG